MTEIEIENRVYQVLEEQHALYLNKIKVIDILQNYFGEDNVDYSFFTIAQAKRKFKNNFSITDEEIQEEYYKYQNQYHSSDEVVIKFDKILITNEYGAQHLIRDAYIKIEVLPSGHLERINSNYITICRATFTEDEFDCRYVHSHTHRLDLSTNITETRYAGMCLGTGPLYQTTNSLNVKFDTDIWQLFCVELDNYLQVESSAGGPYIYIAEINNRNTQELVNFDKNPEIYKTDLPLQGTSMIKAFTEYLCKLDALPTRTISTDYTKYSYTTEIASNETLLILTVTKLFNEWFNSYYTLSSEEYQKTIYNLLHWRATIYNGQLYTYNEQTQEAIQNHNAQTLFTFKGQKVVLKIIKNKEEHKISILPPNIVLQIVKFYILRKNMINIVKYMQKYAVNKLDHNYKKYKLYV